MLPRNVQYWAAVALLMGALVSACGHKKATAAADGPDGAGDAKDALDVALSSDAKYGTDAADRADATPGVEVGDAADRSDADTGEAGCVGEGQPTLNTFGANCCPGLRYIVSGRGPPSLGQPGPNCSGGIDPPGVCSRCGNGVCEDWERPCGCPQDCGPVCGDETCPPGSYCRQQAAGTDSGAAIYTCIDIASDCDGGTFSCTCTRAKECVLGCLSERFIVQCPGI